MADLFSAVALTQNSKTEEEKRKKQKAVRAK